MTFRNLLPWNWTPFTATSPRKQPRTDSVICPNCAHQFVAIPIAIQQRLREAEAKLMLAMKRGEQVLEIDENGVVHDPAVEAAERKEPIAQSEIGGWFLNRSKVNSVQEESIEKLIRRCRGAHYVDVIVRINGKDERYQVDWLKHLAAESGGKAAERKGPSEKEVRKIDDALTDALAGWRYIRETHGELYGVGWERVESKLLAAILDLSTVGGKEKG